VRVLRCHGEDEKKGIQEESRGRYKHDSILLYSFLENFGKEVGIGRSWEEFGEGMYLSSLQQGSTA
jgi:hypothetical protein